MIRIAENKTRMSDMEIIGGVSTWVSELFGEHGETTRAQVASALQNMFEPIYGEIFTYIGGHHVALHIGGERILMIVGDSDDWK